jgi:hypothetical protein
MRLGWKGLQGTNTLTYYENPQITAVKSFKAKTTEQKEAETLIKRWR